MKRPDAILYGKKNELKPFEDESSLGFFARKSDAALFVLGYDSKKRPQTLLVGRFFDHHVLDMMELHLTNYRSIQSFKNTKTCSPGCKPCFVFHGEIFEQNEVFIKLKSLLLELLGGQAVDKTYLSGLEHVVSVTAVDEHHVMLRTYHIALKKSPGSKLPKVELSPMGPFMDFKIGRSKLAGETMMREAYKRPKVLKVKKVKNVSHDALGDQYGRIHNPKQDLSLLQTRKVKALKRQSAEKDEGAVVSKTDRSMVVKEHRTDLHRKRENDEDTPRTKKNKH